MATVKQLLDWFEGFAPTASAMDFDNVGLLVGDKDQAVSRVLLSLDITAGVVDEAAALGCELILSHHPVIFQPLKRMGARDVPYLLAQRGIAAVCMHTNLDVSPEFGVNTCLAEAIGVKDLRRSDLGECLFIGKLEKESDILCFAKHVKKALNCEGLRYTDVNPKVKTVAVASGAGGSGIIAAAGEGADVLVTGEIKHHDINEANALGVNIIDAGHFKSEDIVILPLKKRLEEAFSEIIFTKSQVYGDKIKYL